MFLASQDLRVEDDVAKDSPWACFGLYGTSASTLVGNTATGCSAGFDLDDATGNTLRDNTANANNYEGVGGNGFSLGPTASENLLADNTANLNNFGFNVSGSSSNTFTSNTANRNTSYGIAVGQGASFNTISFNVAHQNGELDALQYDTEPTNDWIGNSFGTWSGF